MRIFRNPSVKRLLFIAIPLSVCVKRLPEKIEGKLQNPKIIRTVRGIGYKAGD